MAADGGRPAGGSGGRHPGVTAGMRRSPADSLLSVPPEENTMSTARTAARVEHPVVARSASTAPPTPSPRSPAPCPSSTCASRFRGVDAVRRRRATTGRLERDEGGTRRPSPRPRPAAGVRAAPSPTCSTSYYPPLVTLLRAGRASRDACLAAWTSWPGRRSFGGGHFRRAVSSDCGAVTPGAVLATVGRCHGRPARPSW